MKLIIIIILLTYVSLESVEGWSVRQIYNQPEEVISDKELDEAEVMAVTLSTTKKPSKTKKPPKSPSIKPVKLPADRPQNTGKPAKGTPKPKPGKNQQKPTKQSNKPVKASTNNPGKASSTKKSKVPPNKWGQPNQNNLNNKSTKKPFVLDLTENFIP